MLRFGGRPFDGEDARRVGGLARELSAVLRAYVTSGPLVPEVPALPPAVLVLGADHRVRSATAPARAWREQLRAARVAVPWIGEAFLEGLSLLARRGDPVVVAPAVGHGRWVAFHGQRLSPEEVAVVFETASGPRLLPAFCEWYGITPRERQVLADVYDGAAPKNIARRRGLSVHTVNDHLKAVFRKTGAGGRDELVTAFAG
ncbi:helix-turn-helix transcriptional regulator [Actinosynnema sp. NPDC047251]|uniref:helix-turn-helix transcriptional regulator n=1 Tax=Saccharothrix espanaensis TaxID=103731 RepID=UPI00068547E2|nr:LuxR C-terminal-related transcriptional regulator [Saccharothrix espanaensis]